MAILWLSAIIALAGFRFSRSATSASELLIDPDEVEYVSGAMNMAAGQGYRVDFAGRRLPSQYPPAFSVLLTPFYYVSSANPGSGIYLVTAFGLLGITCTFLAAYWLGGLAPATIAGLAVIAQPAVAVSARMIMTDAPSMSLGLLMLVLLIRARRRHTKLLVAAAITAALATMLRPLNLLLILPVLFAIIRQPGPVRRKLIMMSVAVTIAVIPVVIMLICNKQNFGEFTRDGYKFWAAVPYDYLSMEFSPRYIHFTAGLVRERPVGVPVFVGFAALGYALVQRWWRDRPDWRELFCFLTLGLLPITLAYSLYYFSGRRFHLTFIAIACITAACVTVEVSRKLLPVKFSQAGIGLIALVLAAAGIYGRVTTNDPTVRQNAAASIRRLVPPGSIVISTLDPVYFSLAADRANQVHYIPLSRISPKMARLLMTAHRIPDPQPPPSDSFDPFAIGLVNGGAVRLFDTTAAENPQEISAALSAGHRVFLDLSCVAPGDPARAAVVQSWHCRLLNDPTQLYEVEIPASERP